MSIQEEKLKAIADAIREKKGTTEPIKANNFASEILTIQSGGGGEENANIYKLEQVQNETGNYTLNIRRYNPEVDTLENVYVVGQARGNLYVPNNVYQLYLTEVKY